MQPGDADSVPMRKTVYRTIGRLDGPDYLVAGNQGREPLRQFALDDMEVCTTYAACVDLDQQFTVSGLRKRNIFETQGPAFHWGWSS